VYDPSSILHLPGTCTPRGSVRHHGALRPLARASPTDTFPTDSQAPTGQRPERGRTAPKAASGPAPLALVRSILGIRRGPSSAWCRPRFSPAFPGPAQNEGPGCSRKSLSRHSGSCAPRILQGRLSASGRSETWPGGFAQAGQSRGPGTDRPGSSSWALLPRPRVTPRGDTYATRPLVPMRWGHRCRVVCPLGTRAVPGPLARRPGFRVPWVRLSPPRPARGSPGTSAGASVPGPFTWCPTRILFWSEL
jgi:hypothetical protein